MSKPANFSELLAPISQETFFAEYWETKPLHISRANSAFYASLVTVRELDDLITSGHLRYPGLQIAKGGQYVAPEVYTQNIRSGGENFTGILDLDRVSLEYQAGATITLPALQQVSKNIGDLACALESELDHAVQANAYLTPGGATGFTPHYDTHEVFILQIGGEKHWCIYEPPIKLPIAANPLRRKITPYPRHLCWKSICMQVTCCICRAAISMRHLRFPVIQHMSPLR